MGNLCLLYHYFSHISLMWAEECRSACAVSACSQLHRHLFLKELLGWQLDFEDFVCGFSLYFPKMGKGVSISSTYLLSVCQSIMMSPRDSRWKQFKAITSRDLDITVCTRSSKWYVVSFPHVWIWKSEQENITNIRDFGHCSGVGHDKSIHGHTTYSVAVITTCYLCGDHIVVSGYIV